MATRTREQRRADNIRNETQRRINQGDTSSYVQGQIRDNPGQFKNTVESYQAGQSKPELKEITLSDGTKMNTFSSFEPGQFAGNQYADVLKYGVKPTDPSTNWMDFGFGSVFGTSSGSTASSTAVQNSIRAMTEDLYNQGYSEPVAAQIAMEKMYPGWFDYSQEKGDIPVNFMDMNKGNPLPGHTMIMDEYTAGSLGSGYSGSLGGPGFSGYGGYGGGGDSGGGGGGGGYLPEKPQFPGRGGEQWGQQDPMQQMMISLHGGPGFQQGFARGGIVSLVT